MDTLMKALDVLASIESVSARSTKLALLHSCSLDRNVEAIVKELLSIALDWYRHFGVRTFGALPTRDDYPGTWEDFTKLVQRLEEGACSDKVGESAYVLSLFPYPIRGWLIRCLCKELRIGVDYKTVNKIFPGLIRTFECQLADVFSSEDQLPRKIHVEPKIDGVRAILIYNEGKVSFLSRAGKPLFNTELIEGALHRYLEEINSPLGNKFVLDGELYAGSFNETMQIVKTGVSVLDSDTLDKLEYHAFDAMSLEQWEEQTCNLPLRERRNNLCAPRSDSKSCIRRTPAFICFTKEQVDEKLRDFVAKGYEGIMLKDPEATYCFGRSSAWLKYKPFVEDSFQIIGVEEGSGKHVGRLGAFQIQLPSGIVCSVGGGFSDFQRDSFWIDPPIGMMIDVKYKEIAANGALREPVFLRIREDLNVPK